MKYLRFFAFLLTFEGFAGHIWADDLTSGVEVIEINYDDGIVGGSAASDTNHEWIELVNKTGGALNISAWNYSDTSPFPGSPSATLSQVGGWGDITNIPNGAVFVVCRTSAAFEARYGPPSLTKYLAKASAMSLTNSGDNVWFRTGVGVDMQKFTYPDNATDKSIVKSTFTDNEDLSASWVAGVAGGTPFVENYAGGGGLPPPVPTADAVVKITEVAPSISGGDYIEFFVQTAGAISGWTVKEGATTLKTFPALTPKAGQHIVLHVASSSTLDETDSTGDTNGNGYIDLFSTDSGLTGTDNAITLKDTDDQIVDFMSYADDSTTYTGSKPDYDAAVAAGQWIPGATSDAGYISGSVAWSGLSTQSMSRVADSSGNPTDNNRKDDWILGNQSPGDGFGVVPQKTASTLEVFQSPFSPFGDGRFNKALIAYNVPENSLITIRVFDLQGRQVRTLLDAVSGGGASASTFWDGKDDFGNVLPVGIYLVNVEAQDKSSGDLKKSSKSVVLGRKLK